MVERIGARISDVSRAAADRRHLSAVLVDSKHARDKLVSVDLAGHFADARPMVMVVGSSLLAVAVGRRVRRGSVSWGPADLGTWSRGPRILMARSRFPGHPNARAEAHTRPA